jgi:predicted RNase H-like HicB family nuclease
MAFTRGHPCDGIIPPRRGRGERRTLARTRAGIRDALGAWPGGAEVGRGRGGTDTIAAMISTMSGARQKTIHAFVRRGEARYVAECVEIAVVTQGDTLDETAVNLREAVTLHLEGEDLASLGLAADPILSVTFELEAVGA